MVLTFTRGRTVQRIPYVRTDRNGYGAESIIRGAPADVPGCGFDPESTTEDGDRVITQRPVLYVPSAVTVHTLDRWIVDGATFEVFGEPARVRNDFTGDEFNTEIELEKVQP